MRISTKTRYGLRALVLLAQNYPKKELLNLKEISGKEKISLAYLEKIAKKLKERKIIKSQKGKTGGYVLVKNPSRIKIGEIFNILENKTDLVFCLGNKNNFCSMAKSCCTKKVWLKMQKSINTTLNSITLKDLIK